MKKIKIMNMETKEFSFVNSIYEIPNGWTSHIPEENEVKKIKIYNIESHESSYVNSLFEIPNGWTTKLKSKETRKKMSESAKKRGTPKCAFRNKSGKNNPMFGKHHSKETKEKIRETKQEKQLKNKNYGLLGKKAYYHKDTFKIKYFFPNDEIPSEYIKGRPPKR